MTEKNLFLQREYVKETGKLTVQEVQVKGEEKPRWFYTGEYVEWFENKYENMLTNNT